MMSAPAVGVFHRAAMSAKLQTVPLAKMNFSMALPSVTEPLLMVMRSSLLPNVTTSVEELPTSATLTSAGSMPAPNSIWSIPFASVMMS